MLRVWLFLLNFVGDFVGFLTNLNFMDSMKNLAVIGSTGSIGTQTLQIVETFPDDFKVTVLAAGSRVDDLIAQARKFRPKLAVIARRDLFPRLHDALAPLGIETACGPEALADAMERPDIDMVVTATVGFSGLMPTVRAIKAGKDIALANKETLVVAGHIINSLLSDSKSRLYPVDSEHSAIAQCLVGENPDSVRRLIITASGGPFRTWTAEQIANALPADALQHPKWNMGAKITIDSATMLNKAFEIIEAYHLFGIEPKRIKAVVHPQSIVHSMVEFKDGAVKAQLGVPDMKLPIAYALGCKKRLNRVSERLCLADMAALTFEEPDLTRFPCLGFASVALQQGGNVPCVINAANEIAVAAFLAGNIKFNDIYRTISHCLEAVDYEAAPSLDILRLTDAETRQVATNFIISI